MKSLIDITNVIFDDLKKIHRGGIVLDEKNTEIFRQNTLETLQQAYELGLNKK